MNTEEERRRWPEKRGATTELGKLALSRAAKLVQKKRGRRAAQGGRGGPVEEAQCSHVEPTPADPRPKS
jgi:hypothetical protein